jgi:hypothetical protein
MTVEPRSARRTAIRSQGREEIYWKKGFFAVFAVNVRNV